MTPHRTFDAQSESTLMTRFHFKTKESILKRFSTLETIKTRLSALETIKRVQVEQQLA